MSSADNETEILQHVKLIPGESTERFRERKLDGRRLHRSLPHTDSLGTEELPETPSLTSEERNAIIHSHKPNHSLSPGLQKPKEPIRPDTRNWTKSSRR